MYPPLSLPATHLVRDLVLTILTVSVWVPGAYPFMDEVLWTVSLFMALYIIFPFIFQRYMVLLSRGDLVNAL